MSKSNHFSSKYESKSTKELRKIASSKTKFVEEAKQAAKWELEKRATNGTLDDDLVEAKKQLTGEAKYQNFEKSIITSQSLSFTPNYSESFKTNINVDLIYAIAEKAFKRLEWDIVHSEKNQVEAKRKDDFGSWREKITVSIGRQGDVQVKSSSLGTEMYDFGRNSKRVKLFIHVFQEVESEYDKDQLESLSDEISKKENWDDYNIPDKLPKPKHLNEPQVVYLAFSAIGASILLAGLFAISSKYLYIILLFESGIGIALAYLLMQGIKLGNYTNYITVRMILGFSVIAIVILTQYFQYLLIVYENNIYNLTFLQFIQLRLEAGFTLRDFNMGWIGWLVVIVIQLVAIYYTGWLRLAFYITNFQIQRIPEEVLHFATYHFVKGKSEIEVMRELAMKGWSDKRSQKYIMDAIGAIQGQQNFMRME